MTTIFKARFDGKVLVPLEPVDLPVGEDVELLVVGAFKGPAASLSPAERADRIRQWGASAPEAPADVDVSREGIYEPPRGL